MPTKRPETAKGREGEFVCPGSGRSSGSGFSRQQPVPLLTLLGWCLNDGNGRVPVDQIVRKLSFEHNRQRRLLLLKLTQSGQQLSGALTATAPGGKRGSLASVAGDNV